jgi:iron complex outermembrane receptor protein
LFSQKDTVDIAPFKIVEQRNSPSYKTTNLDSTSIFNANNLAELLSNNSTIFIKSYGSGSLATASFRGTGASHTKVQWNGINLNSPMNGQIDFSLFPTFFFNDVEIHYGASGLIDGNGALGGSIIMENKEDYNKGFSTKLRQSVGSFGIYTTTIKGAYSNKRWFIETKLYNNISENNFTYINSSKSDKAEETQVDAEVEQWGIQQAVYRKFKNSSLGARLWYFNSDRNLPRTMLVAENDENQTDKSLRGLLEWKGLLKRFQYRISSGFVNNDLDYNNELAKIYSENKSYLSDNNVNTKFYLNNNFILINNINIRYESAKADGYNENHARFNNSWLIGINKKFNRLNIDFFNRLIMVEKEIKPIAPSLGIRYQILNKEVLYIKTNSGINYNYPTFNDLFWSPGGNENLKPEEAQMSEIGLNFIHKSAQTTINTEVTAFYSEVDNWIIWQPTEFGYWSPNNLKKVENKGVESTLSFSSTIKKLIIQNKISYAYTKSINKKSKNTLDNSLNKQLIYVPYHKFNYGLNLTYKSFALNYNFNYTGQRFTTSDNNWYLPANFISNVSFAKQFKLVEKSTALITFSVNNIQDQNYQSIAWRPMPGRNYLASISFNFN